MQIDAVNRLRLVCILKTSVAVENGELDVEVLRLVLWSESWQGLAETCEVDKCIDDNTQAANEVQAPLSTAERARPEMLKGKWKAYDISAVPVKETDPLSGEHTHEQICSRERNKEKSLVSHWKRKKQQ